jgi:hypothetical protein
VQGNDVEHAAGGRATCRGLGCVSEIEQ